MNAQDSASRLVRALLLLYYTYHLFKEDKTMSGGGERQR